jgi:hypothetical protein
MGGVGAVAEPLVVISLLFGGTWINRDFNPGRSRRRPVDQRCISEDDLEHGGKSNRDDLVDNPIDSRSTSPSLLASEEPRWRKRTLGVWGVRKQVTTPNTRRFRGYFLSRLLEKFPFLVECWYWALIYWVSGQLIILMFIFDEYQVYQLGRAATAVWIVEGTLVAARKHALQVIAMEEKLHIFWELPIQQYFLQSDFMMKWINRTYSFIHIPGSIAFLVWLFYYTNTRVRIANARSEGSLGESKQSPAGPHLYESRRRTMAFCNLLAFIIFTIWPCMPPRLLSVDSSDDEAGKLARSHG